MTINDSEANDNILLHYFRDLTDHLFPTGLLLEHVSLWGKIMDVI